MTADGATMAAPGVTLLAAGYKGAAVVRGLLLAGVKVRRIVSYRQRGDRSDAFGMLVDLASAHGIAFDESAHPVLETDALVFLIGWQYLVNGDTTRCVVFHDSLLPALRGFAPTATAMLRGDREVGVTAFRPAAGVDVGP